VAVVVVAVLEFKLEPVAVLVAAAVLLRIILFTLAVLAHQVRVTLVVLAHTFPEFGKAVVVAVEQERLEPVQLVA
jgi:hypothetical protein